MKQHVDFFLSGKILMGVFILLLLGTALSPAKTYIIQFGGALGDTYAPNALNISAGDTVQWQGTFAAHPLSSISIPTGAASFHQASGTTFTYAVVVAGKYTYDCDFHASLGLAGSFTATITGVELGQTPSIPSLFNLEQNFPNPFNPSTVISYELPSVSHVRLSIFNLLGNEIAVLDEGIKPAGRYSTQWNAQQASSGVYFYRLTATRSSDGQTSSETRKLTLLR